VAAGLTAPNPLRAAGARAARTVQPRAAGTGGTGGRILRIRDGSGGLRPGRLL